MKVIVAGGTGMIGRRAVAGLVEAGHDVTVLVRSEAKARFVARLGAAPVTCSLFDRDALGPVLAGHDAVVNLATHIPPVRRTVRPSAWAENDRIRIEGSAALVDAALDAGVVRYVQESIAFLYADGGDEWIDEDRPLADPPVPASAGVEAAEASVARFTAAGGTGVVLRFGQFHGADSGHTKAFVELTRWGVSPLPGPAGAYVPTVHLDDAAEAVVAALGAPAGTYNVVDDEPLTRASYAEAWDEALGDPGRVRLLPAALSGMAARGVPQLGWSQRVSNRRFRMATGWSPRYRSAREALDEIVHAAREPRRVRSAPAALALVLLGLGSLLVGGWALASPASFHSSFPGFGHSWVAPDGPFNEHLLRDVGALELALVAVSLAAAASMTVALVRAAAAAHLLFGVPHLLYHATHLAPFGPADQVGIVVSLAVPVVLAAGVLVAGCRVRRVDPWDAARAPVGFPAFAPGSSQ